MYLGNNAAIRGCQEYFNRCAAAGSPIGATQTPTASVTNLALWSQSFAQWAPLQNIAVSTTSATTDPLGGTTANVLVENTTTGVHRLFGAHPTTIGVVYTFSIYAKLATGTRWLRLNYDAAIAAAAVFNLAAGTFVTDTGTATMTNVGNGWFRCSVTGPARSTQAFNPTYPSLHNGTSDIYAGDGTSGLYFWGAQFETGSSVSVYVPTTSTAVTQGITFADPRQLIIDFAQGIDRLGLWNSMVCWPLRSSQNASTTLTARSLGGLGTFDGSLFGLATSAWGANGVNIIGGGGLETLSTPLTTTNSIRSQLAVWNNTGGGTIIPMSSASLGAVRFALRSNNATNACIDSFDGTSNDGFGSQTVPAGFNQSAATYNFASGLFTFNANRGTQTTATRAITFSSGNITMGGWQPSNTGGGSFVLPFALVANVEMSLNNLNAVNNLYRQTLGIGLNLP